MVRKKFAARVCQETENQQRLEQELARVVESRATKGRKVYLPNRASKGVATLAITALLVVPNDNGRTARIW